MNDSAPQSAASAEPRRRSLRHVTLLGFYMGVVIAGYVFGKAGLWGTEHSPLSPLARVGFALGAPTLNGGAAEWQQLQQDVAAVREQWDARNAAVFDLVVAVRGLDHQGQPDFEHASELCTSLHWPRCDAPAMKELQNRSRP